MNTRKDSAATVASHVHCSWVLSRLHVPDLTQSPVQFSLVISKRVRQHLCSTVFSLFVLPAIQRSISADTATVLRQHVTGPVTRVNSDELIDLNAEADDASKHDSDAVLPEVELPNKEITELLLELEARLRGHVTEARLVLDTGVSLHESLERHVEDISYRDEDFALIGEFPSEHVSNSSLHEGHVLVHPFDVKRNNSAQQLANTYDEEISRLTRDIDVIDQYAVDTCHTLISNTLTGRMHFSCGSTRNYTSTCSF
jgi:hypothetical protein